MILCAIDPGNVQSAYVIFDSQEFKIIDFGLLENNELISNVLTKKDFSLLVIEYPKPRGQPMYYQLVDTIFWIGRFVQVCVSDVLKEWIPIDRKDIKMHLTSSTKSKDTHIRSALIEKFFILEEGEYKPAVGLRQTKVPLALKGISKDVWAALAVAVTYTETKLNIK